jgi:hypothetical protein
MKIATLIVILLMSNVGRAETLLKAGIARVEITPSTLMPMYGYANRNADLPMARMTRFMPRFSSSSPGILVSRW